MSTPGTTASWSGSTGRGCCRGHCGALHYVTRDGACRGARRPRSCCPPRQRPTSESTHSGRGIRALVALWRDEAAGRQRTVRGQSATGGSRPAPGARAPRGRGDGRGKISRARGETPLGETRPHTDATRAGAPGVRQRTRDRSTACHEYESWFSKALNMPFLLV